VEAAGKVDSTIGIVDLEKSVNRSVRVDIRSDDPTRLTDVVALGDRGAREVETGELPFGIQEAVSGWRSDSRVPHADVLPSGVNPQTAESPDPGKLTSEKESFFQRNPWYVRTLPRESRA
jgi:hypothetical protein